MKTVTGRWIRGLEPHLSATEAAHLALSQRLGDVLEQLDRLREAKPSSSKAERAVHALRVSTRRAAAAIDAFAPVLDGKRAKALSRTLNELRKAAGVSRDATVRVKLLTDMDRAGLPASCHRVLDELTARARERHEVRSADARSVASKQAIKALRRDVDKLLQPLNEPASSPNSKAHAKPDRANLSPSFAALAQRAVLDELERVRTAAKSDLSNIDRVHELRVVLKHWRYTVELCATPEARELRTKLLPALVSMQDRLGELNDHTLLAKVFIKAHTRAGAAPRSPLSSLCTHHHNRLTKHHAEALEHWSRFVERGMLEAIEAAFASPAPAAQTASAPPTFATRLIEPKPALVDTREHPRDAHRNGTRDAPRRLAAIDIGTNSVRLIVAEASLDGSYRVLDDEKELTRLGRGLHATGKLAPDAIEHTVAASARMVQIARGYGATDVRLVATAAAREAKNAHRLRTALESATGLPLTIIDGHEEAMLAYRSAAGAFDLSRSTALVIDIGGGSTELVLSAPAPENGALDSSEPHAGVIESVRSLPLGAVRLTERFGGPDRVGTRRFAELREHIREELRRHAGKALTPPQIVVGTGGTLTTLGAMARHRRLGPSADGLFSAVQGYLVERADLKHLLDYTRKLPVSDRVKIPGLPPDRADIIVAGLAIIDGVLKHFGVNGVRVHSGGIRDGLLRSMVRAATGVQPSDPRPDPMRGVRRLAESCNFEAPHATHVTKLALSLFDQLVQAGIEPPKGVSLDAEARLLLEAAAYLHDIGYLINYAKHHKHSYHLIIHADLPGLTSRQIQVIACVARYHRSAEPRPRHTGYAALPEPDRALVRVLAGILRFADGLDRTHMQSVKGLSLRVNKADVFITVDAADEPSVDLWGAARKSELFRTSLGLRPHLEWRSASPRRPRAGAAAHRRAETAV